MEGLFDKKHIYGNFQDQPDSNRRNQFPLDIETLEALQNNTSLAAAIGNLTGSDKAILCGCDGTPRTEGYVWMKTPRAPITGELLYYPGGGAGSDRDQCHIVEDDSDITIDSTTYAEAYTTRHLANGAGATTYTFGTFAKVTLAGLLDKIQEQHDNIEALKNNAQYTFVRGMIMLWSGASSDTIPSGWALCDGKSYPIDGENVRTPDLRDKFVIGAKGVNGSGDRVDYNTGETGGATTHQVSITLTASDVPMHRHSYMSDSHSEGVGGAEEPYYASDRVSGDFSAYGTGVGKKFLTENRIYDKQGKPFTTSSVDDRKTVTSTVNTMPPYYVLAYIMKL